MPFLASACRHEPSVALYRPRAAIVLPLTLVRADLLVAAVAPLSEHDRPFVCPRTGKDRHLETAIIGGPLDVPVAGSLAILEEVCWLGAVRAHRSLGLRTSPRSRACCSASTWWTG